MTRERLADVKARFLRTRRHAERLDVPRAQPGGTMRRAYLIGPVIVLLLGGCGGSSGGGSDGAADGAADSAAGVVGPPGAIACNGMTCSGSMQQACCVDD